MSKMSKSLIEAYIQGAENALAEGKSLARGVFKLGIANHAIGDHIEFDPDCDKDWIDDYQVRIGRLLREYEEKVG